MNRCICFWVTYIFFLQGTFAMSSYSISTALSAQQFGHHNTTQAKYLTLIQEQGHFRETYKELNSFMSNAPRGKLCTRNRKFIVRLYREIYFCRLFSELTEKIHNILTRAYVNVQIDNFFAVLFLRISCLSRNQQIINQ